MGGAVPPASLQADLVRELEAQQLLERAAAAAEAARLAAASEGGASDVGGGVGGVMGSPPHRNRAVTFADEAVGPGDRVRLAPDELFRQMQDSLRA
jgi:hypothetical protein